MKPSAHELASELRRLYPRVLGRLVAFTRDVESAEDAVHDAVERALKRWPRDGAPDVPEAWLITVASNCHRDRLRSQRRADALETLAEMSPWVQGAMPLPVIEKGWKDDLLRLLFTSCDPSLGSRDGAALALATVVGLSTRELAQAFLVAPRTMEQRLVRARRKLRSRGVYDVPDSAVAAERLDSVLQVLHLLFNEGYWSTSAEQPIRRDLVLLAIGLARSLHELLPELPEVTALLALLLLHDARSAARLDGNGEPVRLPEQDRSRWDRSRIEEASQLLQAALELKRPGPFQIEAAIAALHCDAETADATDWEQIAALYAMLELHRPGPVVRVNRAFAVGRAHGPELGLELLSEAQAAFEQAPYGYFFLVKGTLLAELGDTRASLSALEEAGSLARNAAERADIERRIAALREESGPVSSRVNASETGSG